jgi:catechol 2,3-dioxygenase-like lactoylglutathione lyase family enzyme
VGDIGVVSTVMVDTTDVDSAVDFWSAILGLAVLYRNEVYAYCSPITPEGPHLAFQKVPEGKSSKNRLHLDVRVPDREAFERQVIDLGGVRLGEHQEGDFPPWTIMADPLGNEFCIYERQAGS